jgi:uncharacterized protein YbjT (DUF2867 family)
MTVVSSAFSPFSDKSIKRVLVAGGTGYLGQRVVRALLDEGAVVTVLVRPGGDEKLGALRGRVQPVEGDVWNPASLRGRARGHSAVIHLVGGVTTDPSRGLTFRHLNSVSARNVTAMAVTDGVPHMVFLSASAAPLGVGSGYLESKRDAERYLQRSGLGWTVVRAPTLYTPGFRRNPLYLLLSVARFIPILAGILNAYIPLSVDLAARGIANLAVTGESTHERIITPAGLRRLGRSRERHFSPRSRRSAMRIEPTDDEFDEPPFGWLPPVR